MSTEKVVVSITNPLPPYNVIAKQNEIMRQALIQLQGHFALPQHSDQTAMMIATRAVMACDRVKNDG